MSEVKHNPKYMFDCENCKFNWCCGPQCACIIKPQPKQLPPEKVINDVLKQKQDHWKGWTMKLLMEDIERGTDA